MPPRSLLILKFISHSMGFAQLDDAGCHARDQGDRHHRNDRPKHKADRPGRQEKGWWLGLWLFTGIGRTCGALGILRLIRFTGGSRLSRARGSLCLRPASRRHIRSRGWPRFLIAHGGWRRVFDPDRKQVPSVAVAAEYAEHDQDPEDARENEEIGNSRTDQSLNTPAMRAAVLSCLLGVRKLAC